MFKTCKCTVAARHIETGAWKLRAGFGQFLASCLRNPLAGLVVEAVGLVWKQLAGWVAGFISVCLETCWLGQQTWLSSTVVFQSK